MISGGRMPVILQRAETLFLLTSLLALAAIGGAWFSELGLGFVPCMLCLWERWPYYIGLPIAGIALLMMAGGFHGNLRFAALLLALIFLVSAMLGAYHAGVEWKFWPGPSGCGGRLTSSVPSLDDFRKSLNTARVVLCDEAPMRILGLSFAGWNAGISLMIAMLYSYAARRAWLQGSSSVSQ
jgi:disulfide bond formation protein DsbB